MRRRSSQTLRELCYYKWEFLRRNPEYQKDYEEFLQFCHERNWDLENEFVRAEAFKTDPSKRKKVKYGLALLEDPKRHIPKDKVEENPFWLLLRDRGLRRPTWPSLLNPFYPKGEPVVRIYTDQFKDKIAARLELLIDLTHPKGEIMARVKRLVDEAIKQREMLGLHVHRKRKRFGVYDQYLRVWDMRNRGLTYKQIAAELYPGHPLDYEVGGEVDDSDYNKRVQELEAQGKTDEEVEKITDREFPDEGKRNPIIQRVVDQSREAESLINGGYLEIR